MRRILVTIILTLSLCFGLQTRAQDFSWLINGAGSVLKSLRITELYKYAHTRDTTFYTSKVGIFDFKLMENLYGSTISTRGVENMDRNGFKSWITSKGMMNSSLNVGLYGIGLSYSFDPFGRDQKDSRFMLSLYGNLLGIDFTYNNIQSYSGYSVYDGVKHDIPYGSPTLKLVNINSYIVLNHKHFSYPSGVCQSYIQRRSSGSVLGGLTYSRNRTRVADMGFDIPDLKIDAKIFSLGAGYGYNYVPRKNVQFSIMFMPKFVIYDSSRVNLLGKRSLWMLFKKTEITYSGSFAAVKWYRNFYLAFTALADGYSIGNPLADFSLNQLNWHIHGHIGINF